MKSKVMGVDAANRRKNEASGVRGKAAGGAGAGASSRASVPTSTRPMPMGGAASGYSAPPHPVDMSGRKDKAPPRRTPEAAIKGYLAKVAPEDRMSKSSAPSKSPRPMARAKFKDGGMVKGECKGTSGMVSGKKFSGTY